MTDIIFNTTTGQIAKTITVPAADLAANIGAGEASIPDAGAGNDAQAYVDVSGTPTHTAKTALGFSTPAPILADGIEEATINAIPADVYVTWPDGLREEVTDGLVEFAVDQPGTYTLTFDGVKYLTESIEIAATL